MYSSMFVGASEIQMATLTERDWQPVLLYPDAARLEMLARIPSARTLPHIRAELFASLSTDILASLCKPTESTPSQCASLIRRIAADAPAVAIGLLNDPTIARALGRKRLGGFLLYKDSDIRMAAMAALSHLAPAA